MDPQLLDTVSMLQNSSQIYKYGKTYEWAKCFQNLSEQ